MSCYESQDVTGSAGRVTETPELLHDTRENLEKDVRKWCGMYAYQADMVYVWLNRQASITERECMGRSTSERIGFDCAEGLGRELDARCDPLKARIAELCDQVDALTAERDQWKDAFEDSERLRLELIEELEKRDKGISRLKKRRGELMEQVRMLQDDAARARREA